MTIYEAISAARRAIDEAARARGIDPGAASWED